MLGETRGRRPRAGLAETRACGYKPWRIMGTSPMDMTPEMPREEVLRVKLELLQREHRDLDDAIAALDSGGRADVLTVRRLKKRKLMLKDKIYQLERMLVPDVPA